MCTWSFAKPLGSCDAAYVLPYNTALQLTWHPAPPVQREVQGQRRLAMQLRLGVERPLLGAATGRFGSIPLKNS